MSNQDIDKPKWIRFQIVFSTGWWRKRKPTVDTMQLDVTSGYKLYRRSRKFSPFLPSNILIGNLNILRM